MKFKVIYQGFSYIEADNEDEAIELYQDNSIYNEEGVVSVEKVNDFIVEI